MATKKRIVVTNLPVLEGVSLADKLHIYFGKRANGGGDIDSVQLENRNGHPPVSAVITFAEEESKISKGYRQSLLVGVSSVIQGFFHGCGKVL